MNCFGLRDSPSKYQDKTLNTLKLDFKVQTSIYITFCSYYVELYRELYSKF